MAALITLADRIFVAGYRGMAGRAIHRAMQQADYGQLLTATSTNRQQAEELGAAEQHQEAFELASIAGGGVELEGKSAMIKSISDSIQLSMRKRERDEPDAPLLVAGEVDVVTGGEKGYEAGQGPHDRRAIERQLEDHPRDSALATLRRP